MAAPVLAALAGNAISSVGSALIQNALGKANEDRQWRRYYSPTAQVNNLAAAGINPAVAFGNQSPVMTTGGQMQMPEVSNLGLGTTSINEVGNYIKSLADARKAGVDTDKVRVETDKVLTEVEANRLQNDLVRLFGKEKWTNELALSYQNVLLAQKTNDVKEQEKAINEFRKEQEKALSQSRGFESEMLKKRLGNLDLELKLSNQLQQERIATERSSQASNYTQADVNRENRRLQAALADAEESSKTSRIASLISEYQSKNMISKADAKEALIRAKNLERTLISRRGSYAFSEVDAFLDYLKNKISIFNIGK